MSFIENALVVLWDGKRAYSGYTDKNGTLQLDNVIAGTYKYLVYKEGYLSSYGEITVDSDKSISVTLTLCVTGPIDWSYRRSHEIIGSTVGELSDYQVKIKVYYHDLPTLVEIEDVDRWLMGAGEQNQHQIFYIHNMYWIFYCDGSNIVYRTSSDGITWSEKTVIRPSTRAYAISFLYDGENIHYAYAFNIDGNQPVYYRRGTPNPDGTITWHTDEQAITTAELGGTSPVLAIDSDGHVWIVYQQGITGENPHKLYVTKNARTDEIWETESGYPMELDDPANYGFPTGTRAQGSIVALTGGKMYVCYGFADSPSDQTSPVYGRLFDGASWGSVETISSRNLSILGGNSVLAFSNGDDVYCVYPVRAGTGIQIAFNKRTYGVGWGTEENVSNILPFTGETGDANEAVGPTATYNPTTDELWVFYANVEKNAIYYRKRTSGTWENEVAWHHFTVQDLRIFWANAPKTPLPYLAIKFDSNVGAENKVWWLIDILSDPTGEDTVSLGGKCKADFGDVRFRDSDGTTELSYWIEDKVDGLYAVFWVKIPNIPASPNAKTIYVYYGKADAETTSNGEDTFLFFEDFLGDSLDLTKWDLVNSPTVDVSGGICTVQSPDGNWRGINSKNTFGPYGIAWRSRKQFQLNQYNMAGMENASNLADDAMVFFWLTLDREQVRTLNEGTRTTTDIASDDKYHVFEITWKSGECKFYIDDGLVATHTNNIPDEALKIWIECQNAQQSTDWVLIRKYVDPEPTHGSWGAEESI